MLRLTKYSGTIKKTKDMKNFKYILLLFCTLSLTYSCENDGGLSNIDLVEAAIPNITKVENSATIINLNSLTAGDPVALTFLVEVAQGEGSYTSADVVGVYKTATGLVYNAVLEANAQLPAQYTITEMDLVAAFAELNTISDIKLGDVLSITTRFTLNNGLVFDVLDSDGSNGTGTNIQNNVLFNAIATYPVSCPTALEGNYTSNLIATNDPTLVASKPVTITQTSAGTYSLSDGSAEVFAGTLIALQFTDVCGAISVSSPSISFPGQADFIDNGSSLDPVTGIITLDLEYTASSCCGLPGIKWTLELVPN